MKTAKRDSFTLIISPAKQLSNEQFDELAEIDTINNVSEKGTNVVLTGYEFSELQSDVEKIQSVIRRPYK